MWTGKDQIYIDRTVEMGTDWKKRENQHHLVEIQMKCNREFWTTITNKTCVFYIVIFEFICASVSATIVWDGRVKNDLNALLLHIVRPICLTLFRSNGDSIQFNIFIWSINAIIGYFLILTPKIGR